MKASRFIHAILCFALGAFFIYAGVKKFMPKGHKPKAQQTEEIIQAAQADHFENPLTFKVSVKMLKTSGFLKFVGILQMLAGLLILIPASRFVGLIVLLPLTVNVFCFHYFMDNRPEENLETGLYLLGNLVLLAAYYPKIRTLFNAKIFKQA